MSENMVGQASVLLYISPLTFSALLGLFLAMYIWRQRAAPGARALAVLSLGASLWSAGYALEFLSPGLATKLLWAKVQYFGVTAIPLAWIIFAVRYLGAPAWLARSTRRQAALGVIPLMTLVLVWTNGLHGLIWREVGLHTVGPVTMLEIAHGPWFWVYWIYSYVLLMSGTIMLAGWLLGATPLYRWQIRMALLAILIPWIGNLAYVTGLNPVQGLDWTPFGFTLAGLLFTLSLFRFHLVDILPIAQRTVFAELPDCLLALDTHDRLVDLNQSAQAMLGKSSRELVGAPLARIMPAIADKIQQANLHQESQFEISLGEEPQARFYEARISPLSGPDGVPIGRLVVCHEITQHKQQQALLEGAVSERTQELRQAVEQLRLELEQRTLAEERLQEVVEATPDALLLVDQSGSIWLINAQAERLFGYTRQELLGRHIESLIPRDRRAWYREQLKQFFENPSIQRVDFDPNLSALRKDGTQFPIEISMGPLNTPDGFWMACSVRDITERVAFEQEQVHLLEELGQSQEWLQALASRLQEVQEYERRRIAAELHDRVGQNLTGLNLNLKIVEDQLGAENSAAIRSRLEDSLRLVEETTRQVRDVMVDLHPPMLDEYGLYLTLEWYSDQFAQRTRIDTRVAGSDFQPRLSPDVELTLFRLVQEALNNTAKHARASHVTIRLEASDGKACLEVEDDGRGFDPQALDSPGEEPRWGLVTMQQRVASMGGRLSIDSAPGQGTRISVTIERSGHAD